MDQIEDKEEWVDYPYLGIGEKPNFNKTRVGKKKIPTDDQIERIISGWN